MIASQSERYPPLIRALQQDSCYPHAVGAVEIVETHISWVLLTGPYAYKIKKPVELGFLDFSTLEKRRLFCEEEVRLNRRSAPDLYLEAVPITGADDAPVVGGLGEAIEYAVKMVQFSPDAILAERLRRGLLQPPELDTLAGVVADFHQKIASAPPRSHYGLPERVYAPVQQNFEQIRPRLQQPEQLEKLRQIEEWSKSRYASLRELMTARRKAGFVRECHGDLHLNNVATLEGRPTLFDCIEFNADLRWIDVISELAFFTMDLQRHGQAHFAARFTNAYLEATGDYVGLPLLRFYQSYRAMVRAKVAAIRVGQGASGEDMAKKELDAYLDLALAFTRPRQPLLLITHGLSGSGKTTLSQPLLESFGAIRVRSDVERKRLFGIQARDRSNSPVDGGIYTADANLLTYQRLLELCRTVLEAGHPAIADATFLKRDQRAAFHALASEHNLPFVILHFDAPQEILHRRLTARLAEEEDASEANARVLANQLTQLEPLTDEERGFAIEIDSSQPPSLAAQLCSVNRMMGRTLPS